MKPSKKTNQELFTLIEQKIKERNYLFVKHAKERQQQRNISDLDVLNILEGKPGYDRKKIRIILTFTDNLMPIITVINLSKEEMP